MVKVFLSAGHGGSDSGAVANGFKEKDVNLTMMLACREELVRHGVVVVCSRISDVNDSVGEEVREANRANYDIVFSIHNNAGGGDGFEAYYYDSDAHGKRLAQLCEKHVKAIGQNSRGIKKGSHLYFVRETKATAVLVEGAFLDNKSDVTIIDTVAEQRKFGSAYAKAILEYFGIAYKVPAASSNPSTPTSSGTIYRVQVGAFSDKKNAEKLAAELKAKGYSAIVK